MRQRSLAVALALLMAGVVAVLLQVNDVKLATSLSGPGNVQEQLLREQGITIESLRAQVKDLKSDGDKQQKSHDVQEKLLREQTRAIADLRVQLRGAKKSGDACTSKVVAGKSLQGATTTTTTRAAVLDRNNNGHANIGSSCENLRASSHARHAVLPFSSQQPGLHVTLLVYWEQKPGSDNSQAALKRVIKDAQSQLAGATLVLGCRPIDCKSKWLKKVVAYVKRARHLSKVLVHRVTGVADASHIGAVWNQLLAHVSTALIYVLDYDFHSLKFGHAQLVKHMLQSNVTDVIAGWQFDVETDTFDSMHCRRTHHEFWEASFPSYSWQYPGADQGCMICDRPGTGTFLAHTSVVRSIIGGWDEGMLLYEGVLADFWLKAKKEKIVTTVCPSTALAHSSVGTLFDPPGKDLEYSAYRADPHDFHHKWQVKRLHGFAVANKTYDLGCNAETKNCEDTEHWQRRTLVLPPCCKEKLGETLDAAMDIMDQHGIMYAPTSGTLVSMVKVSFAEANCCHRRCLFLD